MAQKQVPTRLARRTLSGRGIIQIPYDWKIRRLTLFLNVVRLPKVNFTSSKWNPDRSEYVKITWMRGLYVLREDTLNYEHQILVWDVDPTGYLAKALLCQYSRTTSRLGEIAAYLGGTVAPDVSEIFIEPIADMPDVIKIVCRDDTAIDADLYQYKYDIACDDADTPPPPPPNPPPRDKVPEGMPIGDIAPPYNEPNDNGDSVPHPGDEQVPDDVPNPVPPCNVANIKVRLFKFDQTFEDRDFTFYVPFYDVSLRYQEASGDQPYAEFIVFDVAPQQLETCNEEDHQIIEQLLRTVSPMFQAVILLSIQPL